MLCDISIASSSSVGVNCWLYFSELLHLKLRFCFSVLFLKVRKCEFELLTSCFTKTIFISSGLGMDNSL